MKTIDVKLKHTYTLAELRYRDANVLGEYVVITPQARTDLDLGYKLMCYVISRSFYSYYLTIPYWKVFKKIRYYFLSNWKFLKNAFPIEQMQMFEKAFNALQPKTVNKKTEKKKE